MTLKGEHARDTRSRVSRHVQHDVQPGKVDDHRAGTNEDKRVFQLLC